jgi:Ribbon-helix-helix protein, copG family
MTSTMYPERVKTITITIPEELDERAAAEARRQGISKSELIRRGLGAILPDLQAEPADDPWRELAGFGAPDVGVAPGEIDEIVYGR